MRIFRSLSKRLNITKVMNNCPWCEEYTAEFIEIKGGISVECPACGMRGPAAHSTEVATKLWNAIRIEKPIQY